MRRGGNLLSALIIVGLVAGVLVGQYVLYDASDPIGDGLKRAGELVLIRPLTLLIIPLVLVSVVVAVTSIGNPSRLGLVGGATLLFYITSMVLAAALGAALVTTVVPGRLPPDTRQALVDSAADRFHQQRDIAGNIQQAQQRGQDELGGAWTNIVEQMLPTNIVSEMAGGRPLGVITFALLLGLALAVGGAATAPAVRFFEALFDAIMRLVSWVIWLTPLGVFFLVAHTVGSIGLQALVGPVSTYMAVVASGLAIHGFIILPVILAVLGRTNPYRFLWQMRRAMLTAFGTASSSATLPVTIQSAITQGGCSRRASNFVLPLGATVNMDGTALYEAVAAVFLFQLFGIDLSVEQLLVVIITATLAAIGAAGIPSAGLVTMVIVITAVNTSLAGSGKRLPIEAIGVILGVDRLLDMFRTMINVWGDAVGAKIITKIAPDVPEQQPALA